MEIAPSGEQIEIRSGETRATVVEVSGGLRALTVGDLAVLDGFPVDRMADGARGQLLMPWPNRLAGGLYEFDGEVYQLALTEPSQHDALHGLVRWVNWEAVDRSDDAVTMTYRLHPQPGYPFTLDLAATYRVSGDGLHVALHAQNVGDERAPFGAGQHPYFRCGTATIDEALLTLPASSVYRYDPAQIPLARLPVDGTKYDFRRERRVGEVRIDMDYFDLARGEDGLARATLRAPDGPTVEFWMDGGFRHITVFTGDTLTPARRRQGLTLEPMTCGPNAFNTGQDLIVLAPGERWEGSWGVSLRS